MNNDITIDVNAVLAAPDYSITDTKTIREIGLLTTMYRKAFSEEELDSLCRKPMKMFGYAALYPEVINPQMPLSDDSFNDILRKLTESRKNIRMEKKINLDEIISNNAVVTDYNDKYMYLSSVKQAMLDFGKELLKLAAENATTKAKKVPYGGMRAGGFYTVDVVDEDSILNTINQIK